MGCMCVLYPYMVTRPCVIPIYGHMCYKSGPCVRRTDGCSELGHSINRPREDGGAGVHDHLAAEEPATSLDAGATHLVPVRVIHHTCAINMVHICTNIVSCAAHKCSQYSRQA